MSTWRHHVVGVLLIAVLAGGGTATAAPLASLSVANDSDSINIVEIAARRTAALREGHVEGQPAVAPSPIGAAAPLPRPSANS